MNEGSRPRRWYELSATTLDRIPTYCGVGWLLISLLITAKVIPLDYGLFFQSLIACLWGAVTNRQPSDLALVVRDRLQGIGISLTKNGGRND